MSRRANMPKATRSVALSTGLSDDIMGQSTASSGTRRAGPVIRHSKELNGLMRKAKALRRDDSGDLPPYCAELEKAIVEMDRLLLRGGGGGPNHPRAKIATLTGMSQRRARQPSPVPRSGRPTIGVGVALYAFEAQEKNELSCREGDMLTVLAVPAPEGWLVVQSDSGVGLFPEAFLEMRVVVSSSMSSGRLQAESDALADNAAQRARTERDATEKRVASYMHCSVDEWRSQPERPKHLLGPRARTWEGKLV